MECGLDPRPQKRKRKAMGGAEGGAAAPESPEDGEAGAQPTPKKAALGVGSALPGFQPLWRSDITTKSKAKAKAGSKIQCHKCKGWGHTQAQCPSKGVHSLEGAEEGEEEPARGEQHL